MPIRILLVDDTKASNQGLALLFENCDSIELIKTETDPEHAIERVKDDRNIDIILLDYRFKSPNNQNRHWTGFSVADEMRKVRPYINQKGKDSHKIIFFSVVEKGKVDMENGYFGYISKHEDFEEIVKLIELVHLRGIALQMPNPIPTALTFFDDLTDREKQIFCLIIRKALTTKKIAEHLKTSDKTVSTQRKKLLFKIQECPELAHVDAIDHVDVVRYEAKHNLCKY